MNNMEEIQLKVDCFNLKYTLECGQCFRWKKEEQYYVGVIKDRVIKIRQDKDMLYIIGSNMENIEKVITEYFNLDTDYNEIEKRIILVDENVKRAVSNTTGLRFLKQDFFETIISYIISANNNIPRISKSVNEISKRYGTKVELDGEEYYLFPTPEQLKNVRVEDYRQCGVGFRDKYIYDTVQKIVNKEIDLDKMFEEDTQTLKKELLALMGVGPKVADCILLFSCSRFEVFPIDTWVEKIMRKLYFDNKEATKKQIQHYADENFKSDAGIIQQHLFYNIREGMI